MLIAARAVSAVMRHVLSDDAEVRLHAGKALASICGGTKQPGHCNTHCLTECVSVICRTVEPDVSAPGLWQLRALTTTSAQNVQVAASQALAELAADGIVIRHRADAS